jgi:D-sedoheptulose 7-phosphate isomerase
MEVGLMPFPDTPYSDTASYAEDYLEQVARAAASLDHRRLRQAADVLADAYREGRTVFSCGNGGSATIANHLACDHLKSVRTDTSLRPRVVSLSSNVALLTAIANDIDFADVFVYQLQSLARAGDTLLSVSSSGDSENVVRAVAWSRANGLRTVALTGFSGGRSGALAEVHLHADADNYGVVEDVHQSVMHILAQYLRLAGMPPKRIAGRRF